jgi:aldehyde dehydrogenase (NAD+)
MSDTRLEQYRMYIGGEWRDAAGGARFDTLNPYTGKPWASVPDAGADDVAAAVAAARRAVDEGPGRETTPQQRGEAMRRLAALIAQRAETLARIESIDNGKLYKEMLTQWRYLPEWFHYFAGLALQGWGEVLPSDRPNFFAYTRREPIGVVAAITPWNSPVLLMVWKLAAALAAGCTFVVKPSEHTPASTLAFAELVDEAGFPPGVFNVVTGGSQAGRLLVEDPRVDRVAFTGSDGVGRLIAQAAAANFTRVSLELGGKSPQVVFDDADVAAAANGVMAGVFAASGQTCMAGSRLIVARGIHDALVDALATRARTIRLGDPLDPATEMGPAATTAQFEKIVGMIDDAAGEGATLVHGGAATEIGGLFVRPTILTGVEPSMRIARDEVFGPVLSVMPFDTEAEAIALANDTRYGLAAGIWTRDVQRAHRVSARIRAGSIWINAYRVVAPFAPFGGFGHSGIGRENGRQGLDEYLETKTVWVELSGAVRDPFNLG